MSRLGNLQWRTITDSRSPKFFVKHVRLAVAFYGHHRFGIYEVRGAADGDGSYADYYVVTDAETVSDAEVKAGIMPKVVFRSPVLDLSAALDFCDKSLDASNKPV